MAPENTGLLSSFFRIVGCTHPTFTSVPGPPIWSDIRAVLELHDEWTAERQEQLGELFLHIRSISGDEAEDAVKADDG